MLGESLVSGLSYLVITPFDRQKKLSIKAELAMTKQEEITGTVC